MSASVAKESSACGFVSEGPVSVQHAGPELSPGKPQFEQSMGSM